MPLARKRLSLSPAARDFLLAEFRAIARASPSSIRRRSARVAVTFRPCKQGRDALPDRPIPVDQFRLLSATYRWYADARRGPRWRVVLGVHRADLDFPGTGRIRFRCERALDASEPHPWIHPRPNCTAIRSAVVLDQAIRDAEAHDLAGELSFPAFLFGFDPDRPPRFDPIDLSAARASERSVNGLRAWPAELFFRDGRSTLAERPACLFASFAALRGRRVRSPAFPVLRDHGLLPAGVGYKQWLATVRVATGRGRAIQDPRAEGTESARLRKMIENFVLADPARESVLLADLAQACHAMGVKISEGPEGVDALAEILDNPWSGVAVPYAAGIQVVRLAGSPGPTTMSFGDGVADVDLSDLGPDHLRFAPARPRVVGR